MTYAPEHTTVWAEIPVTDLEAGMAFYTKVTGGALKRDDSGPNPVAFFTPENPETGVAGHLYPGKPASNGEGPTVHLAVEGTAEEAAKRLEEAGGEVLSPAVEISAGRFIYCKDMFGNSISLFEGTK